MEKFMNQVGLKFTDTKCIVSGLLTSNYEKGIPENVTFKKSLVEVTNFISDL